MKGLILAKNERLKELFESTLTQFNIIQDEFTENLIHLIPLEAEEESFIDDADEPIIYSSEAPRGVRKRTNKSRFTGPLEGIRNNLGREGNNDEAKSLFDHLIETGEAQVEWDKGPNEKTKCALCNLMRKCTHMISIFQGDIAMSHPIASCCAVLADAAIEFGQEAAKDAPDERKLEELFTRLQKAHGEKGTKKRR
jgi:hypothetical protein